MNNTLKKFTAVFTSALMLTSAFSLGTTTAFADETPVDNYLVAGRPTEIFGTDFDPANHDNDMTTTDNGATYTKTYTVDQAYENVMLKVVKPAEVATDVIWYGDENNGNVTFDITEASSFTVTFTPATSEVSVTGSAVQFKTSMDYSYVNAAGNGEGNWLNGQNWVEGATVNTMTEIEDDVWQITFADVTEGFDRQIKFAVDGGWTFNFGKPKDGLAPAFEQGTWFDAFWDGDNINFDVEEISDITATLDLSEFNFQTKTGAKYKIDITPNNYLVAGRPAEIFGTDFDPANHDNDMDWDDEADNETTFTKSYTVDKAYENVMLKVVKNESEWFGDENQGNVTFNLTQAGTFTVKFDAITHEVTVIGSIVEPIVGMNYSFVNAVGNGEGNWLNGQNWDETASVNTMTEIEDDVWQITFADVTEGFDRQVKFAIDGGWTFNFGKPKDGLAPAFEEGTWFDAFWDGDNINFDVEEISDITLTLDLSEFDFQTKTGAQYKVDIVPNTYLVAGSPAEIFGTYFDPANHDNDMEWDENSDSDYAFVKSYTVDQAYSTVMLKVVKNETEWFGDENQANVTFKLTGPGTFTVNFDALTHEVTVSGSNIAPVDFEYSFVNAVGNGEGNWLNGQNWDETASVNTMTEIEDDVWQISYHNVSEGFDRQVKFAVDGGWTFNFGKPKDGLAPAFEAGVWFDAFWDGDNINFDTEDDCTVILTLDLSNFNFQTKTGAQYKVDIIYNEDIVTGDVNKDGVFNVQDVTVLQQYLAEFITLDADALANADVNGDGRFNVKDVTKMQRVLANLESF